MLFFIGCIFWIIVAFLISFIRPKAIFANLALNNIGNKEKIITLCVMFFIILLCILPMTLPSLFNGQIPGHRNMYEVLTESFLQGHVYIDYGDMDLKLLEMENPYDPALRRELGVNFHWDHAFYNGRYYMYFGVVPVILIFLPYRLLTGTALTTYHATQIFTAFFIIGIFRLFYLLAKRFFSAISWVFYWVFSATISVLSVWYVVDAPALYCTAISSGLCMMIWSLTFFAKAVFEKVTERQFVIYGVLGALFGALAFGCRPTIALANLLAIPLYIYYIKEKGWNVKLLRYTLVIILPYIIVGVLLMIYNYVRFDNFFEFGQTYQLTFVDQSGYGNMLEQFNLVKVINGLMENFIAYKPINDKFPYISFNSILINFPIFILTYFCLFQKSTIKLLKDSKIFGFVFTIFILPYIITIMEVLMSPWLLERYRTDIYWLMGLLTYLVFGLILCKQELERRKKYNFLLLIFTYLTFFQCFLLWCIPWDGNFTSELPEYLDIFEKTFFFWQN